MEKIIPWSDLTPSERIKAIDQYYSIRQAEAEAEGKTYDEKYTVVRELVQECRIYVDRDKGTVFVNI